MCLFYHFPVAKLGSPGPVGSPGAVSEENLLNILRRPQRANSDYQNDDTNAYDELANLQKLVEGKPEPH